MCGWFHAVLLPQAGRVSSRGRDALVPIILDGENAWEYYDLNERPFLRDLYRRITDSSDMTALTVHEALCRSISHVAMHVGQIVLLAKTRATNASHPRGSRNPPSRSSASA